MRRRTDSPGIGGGELQFTFDRLPQEALGISAGWIHPQEKSV